MQDELRVNVDEISAAGLGSLVNCAVVIAAADGELQGEEYQALVQHLTTIIGDADTVETLANQAVSNALSRDRGEVFEEACNTLDVEEGRDACFTIASAVATRAGGIGTKEGIALQQLAKALGITPQSAKYNELLGKGMRLGRAS